MADDHDEDATEYRHVDSATIKSEMPDDVENSSLQAATNEDREAASSVVERDGPHEEEQEDKTDEGDEEEEEDEEKNERYQTAVFTLATFAAVFLLYICTVYSLSSPPTALSQC